jgi:predicted Zn-dependent peptidase
MGVYEYLGLGYEYSDRYVGNLRNVNLDQVIGVAEKYFDTKNYVIATAGDI